jgi:ABC-2 type transport system permease protein
MSTAVAFLRRDFLTFSSYRLSAATQVLSVVGIITMVYFVGETVTGQGALLERYGGSYAAFLLSGLALTDLLTRGLGTLPGVIRQGQQAGTLEPMLAAPLRLFDLVVASSLFGLFQSLTRVVLLMLFGIFVLGFWHDANFASLLVVLVPGAVAIFALSVLFAAVVVLIKQADPIIGAYAMMAAILGGMVFPVEVLPIWIRPLAWLIPISHAMTGTRLALAGETIAEVAVHAAVLAAIAVVLLPASIFAFNWAVQRAKYEGSLVEY